MIKAAIFDLDGTLIDSTDAIVASNVHAFRMLGLTPPPRAEIVADIGFPLEEQMRRRVGDAADECTRIYRAHYAATACANTTLLPGAREMLETLAAAGVKLGFATSKKRDAAEMVLRHLDVLEFFAVRLGPDDVARPKPAPDAVFQAAAELDISPAQLVFVGDMHFDIIAAKEACAPCIAVTTGYESRAELEALTPDAVFDHLGEVTQWVLARLDGQLVPAGEL